MGTSCGDVMKLQIRVDEDGIISDVKFKTFGCGSAIASSSFMTERVKGLSLEEAGKIKNTEDAIRSAIKDYRSKRPQQAETKQKGFIDVSQSSVRPDATTTAH